MCPVGNWVCVCGAEQRGLESRQNSGSQQHVFEASLKLFKKNVRYEKKTQKTPKNILNLHNYFSYRLAIMNLT